MLFMTGCSSKDEGMQMNIYYINADNTALVQDEYRLKAESTEEQIIEVMDVLMDADHNVNYHAAIPESATLI